MNKTLIACALATVLVTPDWNGPFADESVVVDDTQVCIEIPCPDSCGLETLSDADTQVVCFPVDTPPKSETVPTEEQ